jgi:hypothetical protein
VSTILVESDFLGARIPSDTVVVAFPLTPPVHPMNPVAEEVEQMIGLEINLTAKSLMSAEMISLPHEQKQTRRRWLFKLSAP